MKRNLTMTERLGQITKNFKRTGAGFERNDRDYAVVRECMAYRAEVERRISSATRDPALAEDIVAQAIRRVVEYADRHHGMKDIGNVKGFLIKTADNLLVDARRRERAAEKAETVIHEATVGVGMMSTPDHAFLAHLRGRVPARGCVPAVGGREPDDPPGDGARPEVERMLGKVLDAGGGEIVDWLKAQEAKIAASPPCEEPEIGRLVATYYVPLLLSALALDDDEFDAEFPGEGRVSAKQRAELADAIGRHSQDCPRCSLKVSSDRKWGEHVEKAVERESRRFRVRV